MGVVKLAGPPEWVNIVFSSTQNSCREGTSGWNALPQFPKKYRHLHLILCPVDSMSFRLLADRVTTIPDAKPTK